MSPVMPYETPQDRENEILMGQKFEYCNPEFRVVNMPYLSTYDFRVYRRKDDSFYGWLEVKKKPEGFSLYEIYPTNKWKFAMRAKESGAICMFLCERDVQARLWNITSLLRESTIIPRQIKRREDQPEGSREVVFLPVSLSQIAYLN